MADRDRHQVFMPRLSRLGIAPRLLHMDGRSICLERCQPFPEWHSAASESDLAVMRELVLRLIGDLHAAGVCHRDLHKQNLVFRDGRPLIIDVEFACQVDPAGPCYDLYGPSDDVSQPARIKAHYWESSVKGLHEVFGHLSAADACAPPE
jgi:tRNA A-37 threonylcarbamoyl transferase component Bud32